MSTDLSAPPLDSDAISALRLKVEQIQAALSGSAELDGVIADMLRSAPVSHRDGPSYGPAKVEGARWSTDLDAALSLLPPDYNFSVGRRDGVCWAWIQPNDAWNPGEHESRHDHPAGSGLITANTAAIALIAAALNLRIGGVVAQSHQGRCASWRSVRLERHKPA